MTGEKNLSQILAYLQRLGECECIVLAGKQVRYSAVQASLGLPGQHTEECVRLACPGVWECGYG